MPTLARTARRALTALIASAALATSAGAANRVGTTGWTWSLPTPQGFDLISVSFAGRVGYATADAGTLLKSNDFGHHWRELTTGTPVELVAVQAVGARTVLVGGDCTLLRSDDGGRAFRPLRYQARHCRAIRTIAFPSRSAGYLLLSDDSILATGDGGRHFARRSLPRRDGHVSSIAFDGPTNGVVGTTDGSIYRTDDAGRTWHLATSGYGEIGQIAFTGRHVGYAVSGYEGALLRTDDGGQRWTKTLSFDHDWDNLGCGGDGACLLFGDFSSDLTRTSANAITGSLGLDGDPAAVAFPSPRRVVIVGEAGSIHVSDDAGAHVREIGRQPFHGYQEVRPGPRRGLAVAFHTDAAGLARTTDGGRQWRGVPTPEGGRGVEDAVFATSAHGYVIDDDDRLWRTTDGGRKWQRLRLGTHADPRTVLTSGAHDLVVLLTNGIAVSHDDGHRFRLVRSRVLARLDSLTSAGGAIVGVGFDTLVRSSDQGATWTRMATPERPRKHGPLVVDKAAFSSPQVGLVADDDGRLFRTTDGGAHWARVLAVGTDDILQLDASSRELFVVTDSRVLRSADGGGTWVPEQLADADLQDLSAGADGIDYAVYGGALLSTRSGGLAGRPATLTLTAAATQLPHPGMVRLSGRMQPARPGTVVTISAIATGGSWAHRNVLVGAGGSFSTRWKVRRTTTFVAQSEGETTGPVVLAGPPGGSGSHVVRVR
jgi:photosystem II stability/assembly factor-like uncharacterized protein